MAADELKRRGEDPQPNEDDVEGHSMLPNMGISRSIAQSRERDIQQHLKRHDLEAEARAHKKGR